MQIKAKQATIVDKGERNATAGIQCEGLALLGTRVPTGFKGGEFSVQASIDNSDWQDIFTADGLAPLAGIPAYPQRIVSFTPEQAALTTPWPYLRIACLSAQPAGLSFTLRMADV